MYRIENGWIEERVIHVKRTLSPSWDGELSYEKTNQHLNEFIYQLKRKDCK